MWLLALLLTLNGLSVYAQQWNLVNTVKTQSAIRNVFMTSPHTGYAFDNLDGRLLKTIDGGQSWQRQGLAFSPTPTGIWFFNDSTGIVGTQTGTFYRSTNGFASRTTISTSTGSTNALFFVDNLTGFAIANDIHIKKTTDGGISWTLINTGNTNILRGLFFLDAQTGFASGVSVTILKTTNGGTTWQPLSTGYNFAFNDVRFVTAAIGVAVGSGGYVARTTDGGITWTQVTTPTTQMLNRLYVAGNTLFALGSGGVVLRSVNNGASWTNSSVGSLNNFALHINELGVGLLGAESAIYKTIDFGATFTAVQSGTPHSFLNKVSFANDNVGVAVGWQSTNGMANALIRTVDGGRTWTGRTPAVNLLGVHLRADGSGAVGGSSGYNEFTTNFGQSFSMGSSRPAVAVRAVWSQNASTWIMGGGFFNGGLYRTTNSGASFTHTPGGNIYDIYFPSALVGCAGGEGGVLMKTIDAGSNWTSLTSPSMADINTVFFLNENLGFIGTNGTVFKTTDGGSTWTQTPGPSNVMALHFYTADSGYAVTSTAGLLKTINGGGTWINLPTNYIADMSVRDAAFLNGRVVAVGLQGDVFVSYLTCTGSVPTPQVLQRNGVLYSNYASGNQWFDASGPIAGATSALFTPTLPGNYYVVHTNAQGCASLASNTVNVIATALPRISTEPGFRVFPNPARGILIVELPQRLRFSPLQLRDASGALLCTIRGNGQARCMVDLSLFAPGTYYLSCGNAVVKAVRLP